MGFNYYNYGRVKPCGIKNHEVYYYLPSGKKITHPTKLDVEIPEQINSFISERVVFLLYHEGLMYVGRYDTSISIYRQSDELLVGLNSWESPKYAETIVCGYYGVGGVLNEIHLDMRDRQTVYICGHRDEGLFANPISTDFNLHDASFSATVFGDKSNYSIFNERGEVVEAKFWPLQEDIRRQDCRIFL